MLRKSPAKPSSPFGPNDLSSRLSCCLNRLLPSVLLARNRRLSFDNPPPPFHPNKRSNTTHHHPRDRALGNSPRPQPDPPSKHIMAHEQPPEQLLDVFRAAALSVTKLYKSSITAQAKARAEGYQDCLDELLQFLDRENLGLDDGEGWKIRSWANERLDAREGSPQMLESDDDADKPEPMPSPAIRRSTSAASVPQPSSVPQQPQQNPQQQHHQQQQQQQPPPCEPVTIRAEPPIQPEIPAPVIEDIAVDEPEIVVPTRDTFDFRSSHQYPQDAQTQLNIANLRLSDARSHDNPLSTPRSSRQIRHMTSNGARSGPRMPMNHLGRGAGSKRKVKFEEFFDLGNLGPKDGFGGSAPKRRHM